MQPHEDLDVEVHALSEAGVRNEGRSRSERIDAESAHGVRNLERPGVYPDPELREAASIEARARDIPAEDRPAADDGIRMGAGLRKQAGYVAHIMLAIRIDLEGVREPTSGGGHQPALYCGALSD